MRTSLIAGLLMLWPAAAIAQTVTAADLEGHVVEARLVMNQQLRREGRTFPAQLDQRIRVKFLPGAVVEFQMSSTSHTPRGTRHGPGMNGRTTLGKVNDARNMDGGQAVWFFEDGALISLRTYGDAGGYKRTISFSRDDKGLTCNVRAAYMHEDGVGRVATRSVIDNAPVTILSAKQASSACKITISPAN